MSETLPTDAYSRELERLRNNPAAVETRRSSIEVKDLLGNTETWITLTIRTDRGETVFLQRIGAEGGSRFFLPPAVTATIAGQRDQLTARNRRRGARKAVETKREAGIPIGNVEALRKARRAKR
jgi:hypothetical protein